MFVLKYIIFVFVLFFLNIGQTDDSLLTIKQKLDRLQREVSDLSKLVFTSSRNDQPLQSPKKNQQLDLTAFDMRIYDLETDIKKLNANFEDLIFQIDDLMNLYEELSHNLQSKLVNNANSSSNINEITLETKVSSESEENLNSEDQNILGKIVINSKDLSEKETKLIIENENQKKENINITPEEEYQRTFDLLRSQQFFEAKNAFKNFIKNNKKNKLSGSAHYWLGEIYLLNKEYREAALIFAEGYQNFPKSIKAPDMLYKLSESLIIIDKKQDSCNTLQKLKEEFPQHKLVSKVESMIKSLGCNLSVE